MKENYIIPIFLPRMGCTYRCVFCSQENIVSKENLDLNIVQTINNSLSTIQDKTKNIELAFYGGTFTGMPLLLQKKLLDQVKPFIENKTLSGIRISTRPDALDSDTLDILEKYNLKVIEIGVQSLDNEILKASNRAHTKEDVFKTALLLKRRNIKFSFQMMVGLPGETIYKLKKTISLVKEIEPDFLRIHPTIVLKGSKLEAMYNSGAYKPLSMNQAVSRSIYYLSALEGTKTKVIRIGLYSSDQMRMPGIIVAGPFHPAFRELVEGEMFFRLIKNKLGKKTYPDQILTVFSDLKNVSKIRGQHSCNIVKLKKQFGFKDIKVASSDKKNENLKKLDILISKNIV